MFYKPLIYGLMFLMANSYILITIYFFVSFFYL